MKRLKLTCVGASLSLLLGSAVGQTTCPQKIIDQHVPRPRTLLGYEGPVDQQAQQILNVQSTFFDLMANEVELTQDATNPFARLAHQIPQLKEMVHYLGSEHGLIIGFMNQRVLEQFPGANTAPVTLAQDSKERTALGFNTTWYETDPHLAYVEHLVRHYYRLKGQEVGYSAELNKKLTRKVGSPLDYMWEDLTIPNLTPAALVYNCYAEMYAESKSLQAYGRWRKSHPAMRNQDYERRFLKFETDKKAYLIQVVALFLEEQTRFRYGNERKLAEAVVTTPLPTKFVP